MQCKEIECIIPSYIKGEEKEMVALVEAHLKICSSCKEFEQNTRFLFSTMKQFPSAIVKEGYLEKLKNRIETSGENALSQVEEPIVHSVNAESSSVRVRVVTKSSTQTQPSFLQGIFNYIAEKLRTPALIYAVAIHAVVLGLGVFLYQAETKISKTNRSDAQSLRFQAYNNVIHGSVSSGKIKIDSLIQNGEVYITQNSLCIQIQLNKPLKGNYIIATVEEGELKLAQEIVDKYFTDADVSILVFNRAIEVWSRTSLEKYIQEEVAFKPV